MANGVLRPLITAALGFLLFACSSGPAPVEDRSARPGVTEQGLYRVGRGDTLYSIAFSYGLDWKDIASWNSIGRPYTIYPGQELRLKAPSLGQAPGPASRTASSGTTTVRGTGQAPAATTRPLDTPAPATTAPPTTAPPATAPAAQSPPLSPAQSQAPPTTQQQAAPARPPASAAPAPSTGSAAAPPGPLKDPDRWLWPTEGRVIRSFNASDPARKGIDIAGQEGQDVVAAAAGDVVYSGNGLIGFGELIIVKHSESMLTAYAHNSRRLVEEGQRVAAGARIAEMGQNDQEQVMLHFELRLNGRPVDPLKYLPPR